MKRRLSESRLASFETEDVNPMESVANLVDAMLVLAVGIMLALIVAWNVDVSTAETLSDSSQQDPDMVELEENTEDLGGTNDLEEGQTPEDAGLTEAGTVYRDEDGNLYLLENGE